ncbi:MAG: flagellin [Armatimonadetes bacterium]|nr:flagellin [Armatimonadota bacterium]
MALRINYNASAMAGHRTLSATSEALAKSTERLSSGFKVNSAADDPAGLVISEKLRAQVSGLGQAIKNAGDATNMVKTAEGALSEVHRLLRGMRDLALHAANTGSTDTASAQADQSMITNSINSLNKVASETQFGDRRLLDGSAGIKTFVNGTSVMSGDFSFAANIKNGADIKVAVTTAAEKATLSSAATYSALTTGAVSSAATFAATTTVMGAWGTMLINGTTIAYVTADQVSAVIADIEAAKTTTGVGATYNTTTNMIDLTSTTTGAAGTFDVITTAAGTLFAATSNYGTGTDVGSVASAPGAMYINGVKISYASGDTVTRLIDNVNAKSSMTGVEAVWNATDETIDFNTIAYGAKATINVTSGAMFLGTGVSDASDEGVNAVATVTQTTTADGTTNLSDNSWTTGDGLTIRDSFGNNIVLTESGGSATSAASSQFTIQKNTLQFQVGAYANQTREININAMYSHNMGNGAVADANVSTIDVSSGAGAQDAIKILDKAISDVSNVRASLGATQRNVLESSVNSLGIAKENIAASESSIRDTDIAAEMVEFTKQMMLNQAGVAMLSQANAAPQQLLSLIR